MAMPLATRRFTVDEYHRMADAGILHEDDRVELLDGQIVEMSPIYPPHAGCVNRLTRLLSATLGDRATLSVQNPVVLGLHSEPQPDIAVLRPRADGYARRHPEAADALLLVEVAGSSLERDRDDKIPSYAEARVPEVWLVNLPADAIEVYRGPVGGRYTDTNTVSRDATIRPLQLPGVELKADEILG